MPMQVLCRRQAGREGSLSNLTPPSSQSLGSACLSHLFVKLYSGPVLHAHSSQVEMDVDVGWMEWLLPGGQSYSRS